MTTSDPRHGPPLLAPALAWVGLTVATVVLHPGTRPPALAGGNDAAGVDLLRQHAVTATFAALVLAASAVPFAVWVGAIQHRLHRLGMRVAGPTLGLAGGLLAAGMLLLSGLTGWAAAVVAGSPTGGSAAGLDALAFATGGPGFAVAFGLLMAGVSVPVLAGRLVPPVLAWSGLALAVVSVVALVGLVVPPLLPLLPVVRFGGLIWLVWVSAVLPRSRRRVAAGPTASPEVAA